MREEIESQQSTQHYEPKLKNINTCINITQIVKLGMLHQSYAIMQNKQKTKHWIK